MTKQTTFKYINATQFFKYLAPEVKSPKMKMKHGNWSEADRRCIEYGLMKLSKLLMEPVK